MKTTFFDGFTILPLKTDLELNVFDRLDIHDKNYIIPYLLVKRNKLRRILEIGTDTWLRSLSMAQAGGWVVTLNDKPSVPGHYGVFNAYKDRVFQVIQRPKDYLAYRNNPWDLIVTDEEDLSLYMDRFTKYLVSIANGVIYEKT